MSESKEADKPVSAARAPWGSVLAAARLHPDFGQSSTNTTSVLRPPQLKARSNPFARAPSRDLELNNTIGDSNTSSEEKSTATWADESKAEKKNDETAVPKFLPLHSSRESISFAGGTVPEPSSEGLTRTSNFVFGQNLQDRVMKQSNSEEGFSNTKGEHSASNGNSTSSDLLFSTAARATSDTSKPKVGTSSSEGLSTNNVWGQVPESPPPPPAPPAGPILTGEEGETNVIQVNCRLFAFEGGQWKERCRGQLRLNDSDVGSRLVCRAAGSLRVLLNTKVWGDMTVERAGSKSLRVTATDSQLQVKVFLVMASPDEIGRLNNSLSIRVLQAKHREELNNLESKGNTATTVLPVSCPATESELPLHTVTPGAGAQDAELENNSQDGDSLEETPANQSRNPVVIVSAEEDDVSQTTVLKRPLDSDEQHEQSKKVCVNSISNEPEL